VTRIEELEPSQLPALQAFLERVPEGERRWFKYDVLDPDVVAGWMRNEGARHLVTLDAEGSVVAYGSVQPGQGWSSHVGEITLIVDPRFRGRGLARPLARRVLTEALRSGLEKVVVEVVADETSAVRLFTSLGFEPEALLRDHVRDREGHLRDLMILAHPVQDTWGVLAATGVEDEVT
jgi:ribosomal protein S18 acetylase RimI-like enzyme